MAKKTDKVIKDLAKEVKKLRKENEKLGKTLDKVRKDQAGSHREILALIDERLAARDADEPEDHPHDENGGFVTADETADGQDAQEGPEVTDAAERRAKELGVDPTDVKGTGSGGRVLVKDVEAAAGQ